MFFCFLRIGIIWSSPLAVNGVQLIQWESKFHVALITKIEHLFGLGQHLQAQALREVGVLEMVLCLIFIFDIKEYSNRLNHLMVRQHGKQQGG